MPIFASAFGKTTRNDGCKVAGCGSSAGQNAGLSRRRSRVRVPSAPPPKKPLKILRGFFAYTLFTHSLHSLSSLIIFTYSLHLNRISVDKLETLPFCPPRPLFGGQTQYRLNHPINEYAELFSFFPSTFSTYSCFLCLWVYFMLNVFRKQYQFLPVAGPFIVFFSEAFSRRFSRNYWGK